MIRNNIRACSCTVTLAVSVSKSFRVSCVTYVVNSSPTNDCKTELYGRVTSQVGLVEYVSFICCCSVSFCLSLCLLEFHFYVSLWHHSQIKLTKYFSFPFLMTWLTQACISTFYSQFFDGCPIRRQAKSVARSVTLLKDLKLPFHRPFCILAKNSPSINIIV
jgi:hypothetical protein